MSECPEDTRLTLNLEQLCADPETNVVYVETLKGETCYCLCPRTGNHEKSTAELVVSALRRQAEWVLNQMKRAPPEIINRRLAACESCPRRTAAPKKLVYKVGQATFGASDNWICSLCGCYISLKVQRADERCPIPEKGSDLSRWGEPLL